MERAGTLRYGPEWKCNDGYRIDVETGMAKGCTDSRCTLHFYHALPGDRLALICEDYEYQVLIYGNRVDEKYIYTYDYQQEENWASYDCRGQNFSWLSLGEDFFFREECFFRVNLRAKERIEEGSVAGNGFPLVWEQVSQTRICQPWGGGEHLTEQYRQEAARTSEQVYAVKKPADAAFFLLADTHYTVNGTWADTVEGMRGVKENKFSDQCRSKGISSGKIDFQGIIHLGDATDGMVSREITRDYVRMMQEDLQGLGIPLYYTLGNHDSNYFRGNPEPFDRQEMYDLYLGGKPGHYCLDDAERGLRMIFLESFDHREKIRYGFSGAELDWLEERLGETPPDWCVVVFSHVPPAARLHYWSDQIRGSARLVRLLRQFQYRSRGRLLGVVHGHNHADGIDCREGFPIVSIGCGKCEFFTDKKPEGSVTWPRRLEDISRELWDVLVVSTKRRTLDFIRFGAGKNRRVTVNFKYRFSDSFSIVMDVWEDTETDSFKNTIIDSEVIMTKVITYGTYDLFHEGHYNILKRAKALGD